MLMRNARTFLTPVTMRVLRPAVVRNLVAVQTRAKAMIPYPNFENVEAPGVDPTMTNMMGWLGDESGFTGPCGMTVKFQVQTDEVEFFKELFAEVTRAARKAPGFMQYDLVEDYIPGTSGPGVSVFFLMERWATKKDLFQHLQQPYALKFFGRLAGEMKVPPPTKIAMYRFTPQVPE
jgi:quinol monooxygenase YgiN